MCAVCSTAAGPHALQGPGFSQEALRLRKQYLLANPHADKSSMNPRPRGRGGGGKDAESRRFSVSTLSDMPASLVEAARASVAAATTAPAPGAGETAAGGEGGKSNNNVEADADADGGNAGGTGGTLGASKSVATLREVRQRPQTAPGPNFGRSFSVQSLAGPSSSSSSSAGAEGVSSPAGNGLAATRQRIAEQVRYPLFSPYLDPI